MPENVDTENLNDARQRVDLAGDAGSTPMQAQIARADELLADGRCVAAAAVLERAIQDVGPDPAAYQKLGEAFVKRKNWAIADHYLQQASESGLQTLDHRQCHLRVKLERRQFAEAIPLFQADGMIPDTVTVDQLLAFAHACWLEHGLDALAEQINDLAYARDPRNPRVLAQRCMSSLRYVYQSSEEIEQCRARYAQRLSALHELVDSDPACLTGLSRALSVRQPFQLAYQGRDDLDLQRLYGALICRAAEHDYPTLATLPARPAAPATADGRIRIGIVSGYMRAHSNWKLRRSWLRDIDRRRFHVTGYYLDTMFDSVTMIDQEYFDNFVFGLGDVWGYANKIREDQPDVLIYLELGMSPYASILGSLRLAPIQCVTWGHPETSGRPTLDYFITSALMEPARNQQYYSEHLARIDGLTFRYMPSADQAAVVSREELGIPQDAVVFWYQHSIKKLLPEHDDLLPRIAARVGNCVFLMEREKRDGYQDVIETRLQKAFEREGLAYRSYCIFLGKRPERQFRGIMALSDVYLDSLEWNGCNSTLEALAFDLPVVTCAGEFCRSRHGLGFMALMGLQTHVVDCKSAYIDLAVQLALNPNIRNTFKTEIADRMNLIYEDMTSPRSLEEFVEWAVTGLKTAGRSGTLSDAASLDHTGSCTSDRASEQRKHGQN